MEYKIWYGLAHTQAEYMSMQKAWMPRLRDTLHDALYDAMKINEDGTQSVWAIESSDGTILSRPEIIEMVRQQRETLIAQPPKKY